MLRTRLLAIHRWMGVAFCVPFLMWFVSGMVLMYCPFPQVDAEARLRNLQPLDAAQIRVPASGAAATEVRLYMLDGQAVYRLGPNRIVYAGDGHTLVDVPRQMALRIAAAWTRLSPADAVCAGLLREPDQWTVNLPREPLWKFGWPGGAEIYVSAATGDVVQSTTRASRWGAYFGAIPHWFYFTALRKHSAAWSRLVECVAALGFVNAALGLISGVWSYARRRIAARGIRRWHVVLGLLFGSITCTWVFSGLLSMEPFPWLAGGARLNLDDALHGPIDLAQFAPLPASQAVSAAGQELQVKELEFVSFSGVPFYLAKETSEQTRVVPMDGVPRKTFETAGIVSAVRRAAAPVPIRESRLVTADDAYYARLPLPAVYVELRDAEHSAYYIDARTGSVARSYNTRSRWNRWLYHGLHSLDFGWLDLHRPPWDIAMFALLLGGAALSATGLTMASRLVRRRLTARSKR